MAASSAASSSRTILFGHPVGLFILFFAEMWERFSYYGMRAILVLYMISSATGDNPGLGWDSSDALMLYGWYTMLVYVMSIPGGILADKFIGQKRAVLYGGLTLVLGHGILAVESVWAFYTGLALIVLGVGGLKPNISTMVGGLYPQGDERRDAGFIIFYIGINVGAFLSALIVGYIGETIGWHYGFGLAGIGMLLGQITFMAGQKYLKGIGEPPEEEDPLKPTESVMKSASFGQLFKNLLQSQLQLVITVVLVVASLGISFYAFEGGDRYAYSALFIFLSLVMGLLMMIYQDINAVEKDRFMVLLLSFLIIIVFWGAFEQAGGLLNIYTLEKIDRTVNFFTIDVLFAGAAAVLFILGALRLYQKKDTGYLFLPLGVLVAVIYYFLRGSITEEPFEIPASVFQSVNALFIIIFGTLVGGFWLWWHKRGYENSSLLKMAVGTIIMGAGFLFMAKASADVVEYGDKAALLLLIFAYLLHTLGELCASPVALSFITKVAPIKYVSIMMGMYFAATGLGNKVAGSIGAMSQLETVQVQLAQSPADGGLIQDTTYQKAMNFELVGDIYLDDGEIRVKDGDESLLQYVTFTFPEGENGSVDSTSYKHLRANLEEEEAFGIQSSLTAIFRMKYSDNSMQQRVKSGEENVDLELYQGQLEVFELQNQQEYKTFVGIFIFTAAFGILLLLFLKRLKKLTHGAEEIRRGSHFEEQEGFEVADN
jgi:POT family proton-dependent oligopeptide transporter